MKAHLSVPFLGMVPDVSLKTAGAAARGPNAAQVIKSPNSAVGDAYRVLRTNLIFTSAETTGRVILVTSAVPGEGKTTTLANLAAALAQNGAKVLAVDADLRRPTLNQHFGLQKTPGLSDLIVGKAAASQAIQTTRIDGLQLLACGYQPPNPAELLGSPMMKQILDAIRVALRLGADRLAAAPGHGRRAGALLAGRGGGARARGRGGDEAGRDAGDRAGAGRRRQGARRRAQQGQPESELLLLQPVLRRVLPQLLRRGGFGGPAGGRDAAQAGPAADGAAVAAGVRRVGVRRGRLYGRGTGELPLRRSNAMRRAAASLLAFLLALPAGDVRSAPSSGTIQGVVRLEGRPLSGVTVAFIELQSGSVVRATSGGDGGFTATAPVGEYAVTTESQAGLTVGQAPVRVAVADGRVASADVELVAVASAVPQEPPAEGQAPHADAARRGPVRPRQARRRRARRSSPRPRAPGRRSCSSR